MLKKIRYVGLVCSLLCVVIMSSGCRTPEGGGDGGEVTSEILDPEELGGNVALGERFEMGTLVKDVNFRRVYFSYDSYQIPRSEIQKIEEVADYMKENREVRLIIEGHCDERGSREYNMSLGEHRALAVRAYLVGLGIDSSRIQTRSYGEEKPLDFGHNESAWRKNRRAEFVLYR